MAGVEVSGNGTFGSAMGCWDSLMRVRSTLRLLRWRLGVASAAPKTQIASSKGKGNGKGRKRSASASSDTVCSSSVGLGAGIVSDILKRALDDGTDF